MVRAFVRSLVEYAQDAYDFMDAHRRLTLGIACLWLGIVLAVVAMKSFATANTNPPEIAVSCDEVTNKCLIARDDLARVSQNYFAVLRELESLRIAKCQKYKDA